MRTGSDLRAAILDAKNRGLYRQTTFDVLDGMSHEDIETAAVLLDRLDEACIEFPYMSGGFDLASYTEQTSKARSLLAERLGFAFTGTEVSSWCSWVGEQLNDTFSIRKVPIEAVADVALAGLGAVVWVIAEGLSLRRILDNCYADGYRNFPSGD